MMIISATMTARIPKGFDILAEGDIIFFEKVNTGAHQFFTTVIDVSTKVDYFKGEVFIF